MNKLLTKKSVLIATLFGIILTASAGASVVSFIVVETGLPYEAPKNRNSQLWEDAFLDVFFDSGYIVSNYPMMRYPVKPEGGIIEVCGFDSGEAEEAGIDYIIVARLDYESALLPPYSVVFYIFRADNHQVIYDKQISGISGRVERESYEEMKRTIRPLVQFVASL
jgi:hypothetical protein